MDGAKREAGEVKELVKVKYQTGAKLDKVAKSYILLVVF